MDIHTFGKKSHKEAHFSSFFKEFQKFLRKVCISTAESRGGENEEVTMAVINWINGEGKQRIPAGNFIFTLTNGFEPGTGHLQLSSSQISELEEQGEVEITVNFEGGLLSTSILIKGIYVDSYTRKTDEKGDSIYTAHLKDRRFLWEKYGEITLFANCVRPDGTYEKGSLCRGCPYTWKEIVLLCIASMGETENLLNPDALPESPYLPTNIDWHSRNPARALREILEVAGYTVALHYDGKLSIVKINENIPQTIPSGYGPTRETGKLFADAPDSVVVIGGPTINQVSIDLEPCAIDTADGKIKGIAEVSYLRGKDVGLELATNFASLSKEPEAQAAARQTVGHLWRIPNTGFFSDDKNDLNRYLLPVLDETCERAGEGEFLTPKLSGAYFEKGTKSQYQNFGGEGDKRTSFPKGWALIDRKRGIVKTGKVSGILTNTEIDALPVKQDKKSAKITLVPVRLTFAHYAREANGSVKVWRYKHSDGIRVFAVHRPDMRIRLIEGLPLDPLYSKTLERSAEIGSSILSRRKEAAVEFGTYAGMQPLRHSGTITSITWTADSKSGYTHYTYDDSQNPKYEYLNPKLSLSGESVSDYVLRVSDLSPGSQAEIHPTDEELRAINVNKSGPILIRKSQELKTKLIEEHRRDDTEGNLFAELSGFDEEHQEPELTNIGPPEELNWNYREHVQTPNPEPDAQDKVWAVQLIGDDKYMIESALNRSTELVRTCDENKGDTDDIWRVRAIPGAKDVAADMAQRDNETRVKIISKEELYRIMWLINTIIGGEGGWITDVPPEGLALTARSDKKSVSPPRRIGQIGDIVILTADDEICITKDGDTFTYANIRHDAHFHKTPQKDGRIHFSNDAPGSRPLGTWVIGKMVCDPALKNQDTELGKESGQWCPQVPIPVYCYETYSPIWFPKEDTQYFTYPIARNLEGTDVVGYVYPKSANKGQKGELQIGELPRKLDGTTWDLGLFIEFGALGDKFEDKVSVFSMSYRVVPYGGDIKQAEPRVIVKQITIPKACPESQIQIEVFDILASYLSDNCLIVIEGFWRLTDSPYDTYSGDVVVIGYKTGWREE